MPTPPAVMNHPLDRRLTLKMLFRRPWTGLFEHGAWPALSLFQAKNVMRQIDGLCYNATEIELLGFSPWLFFVRCRRNEETFSAAKRLQIESKQACPKGAYLGVKLSKYEIFSPTFL